MDMWPWKSLVLFNPETNISNFGTSLKVWYFWFSFNNYFAGNFCFSFWDFDKKKSLTLA